MTRALPTLVLCLAFPAFAGEWTQFRGPNSSGVSDEKNIPDDFGPSKNLVWKTPLPPGHSSPVFSKTQIYLTAYEGEKILVIALDRASGRVLWRREAPRPRKEGLHKASTPASPSAVTDGANVYAFFTDFGLISYGPDGNERWRMPLGPFNNPMGMASSPILSGNTMILNCDSESGSFMLALEKDSGKIKWRIDRPEFTRGFSTPLLWKPADGPLQVIIAGSYKLMAYEVENGKPVWWINNLTWQLKPTPVMDGENIYILGWAGESDMGQQEDVPDFAEMLKQWDTNKDGVLQKDEITNPKLKKDWRQMDLDDDGVVNERDWKMYQSRRKAVNAVTAAKLGGKGDMTEKNVLWRYYKSLPNVPSPLYYQGVVYLVKESGIMTALDAKTGKVLKQGRLTGAPGDYFSSPVAVDGKIITISHEGKVSIVKPGADWETIRVIEMGEDVNATPAILDGKLYIRTHQHLYCFAKGA